MKLTLTTDAEEFGVRTRDMFETRVECNLMATVSAGVIAGRYPKSEPLFAYGTESGEVRFAALRTPPWDMLATDIEQAAADELVQGWLQADPGLPGVGGPAAAARPIATAWAKRTGGTVRCRARELAYVLERVTDPPKPAPGSLRPASERERPLLLEWMKAFGRESGAFPEDRAEAIVDARAADGCLWVWDHRGPVSALGTAPPVAGTVRVGPVYTPPEHRRRGYAGTAVATASRQAIAQGASRCLLFTDAANPTSNKIYAEVGYGLFGEHEEWEFVS